MTEQIFEQSIEQFFENLADMVWQYEILIGSMTFIILLIVGLALLKKKKNNAGYIFLGISLTVLLFDVIKVLLRAVLS